MSDKHVKVTLNFTIKIDPSVITSQGEDEYYARQRRLFHEIITNKEDLNRFLASKIHTEFESGHMEQEIFVEEEIDEEKFLAPPISRLSEADQEYYREVQNERIFFEQVDGIFDCFSAELTDTEIAICDCEAQG